MTLNKKIKRRFKLILSSLFAQFAVPVSNIAISILIVRWYSEALWGIYVEHLLVLSLVLTVVNWGSKDFLLKRFSKKPKAISGVLWASIYGKTGMTLLACLCLSIIPLGSLHKPLLMIWIVSRMGWQFFESLNTYRRFFLPIACLETLLVVGMITGLSSLEMNVEKLLLFFILADGIKFIFYGWLNRRFLQWPSKFPAVKFFFKESFPFFLLTLSSLAASRADLYLLSLWEDASTLAQYQILVNFIQYAHLLATAIMIPFLKNIFRLKFDSIAQLERQFIGLGFILGLMLTGGIYLITHFLYRFDLSFIVISLIYVNIVVFYFYFLRIPAGFSYDKMWNVILVMSLMGVINLVLGISIIPNLGMIGGLLSSLAAGFAGLIGFRNKTLFNFQ